jgi:YaiO family outer membrane protein
MKKTLPFFVFGICWTAVQALAQPAAVATPVTLELSTEQQQLSHGKPGWTENTVRLNRQLGPRQLIEASLVQANRFNTNDEQLNATYVQPLSEKLAVTVDGSLGTMHRFLPQHSLGLTLQYEFAPAWLVHGGVKSTRYNDVSVEQSILMVEHYVSAFSWAVAWRPVRVSDTSTSSAELRGSYYYGEKNAVTLSASNGQEATIDNTLVTLANVSSIALSGRHWVNRDWALTYVLNSTHQGDYYSRNGLRIGVQYIF